MEETKAEVDYTNLAHVMAAITNERASQVPAWSAAHDYMHTPLEWSALISRYAARAANEGQTVEQAQEQLVKAAAVCVAAIQAMALWQYGPNPAAALNALQAKLAAQQPEG